jgi:hypothetical protein
MTLAVILQPTYLPWIGFFAQIDVADIFVFYDDVQFVYRSFHRRNRVRTPQGWTFLSVPVEDKFGTIAETKINNTIAWQEEHRRTIEHCYKNSRHFKDHKNLLDDLYGKQWSSLGEMTISHAKRISEEAGISSEFINSSDLSPEGSKTERLIDTLKKVNADAYLTGPACRVYLEVKRFEQEGIDLQWFMFKHPTYEQRFKGFNPYMSFIDLLFNEGAESTRRTMREAAKESITRDLPPFRKSEDGANGAETEESMDVT